MKIESLKTFRRLFSNPILSFFLIMILNISGISAQQVYRLTLEQSIGIARDKSYSMKSLNEDVKIADYNLRSATARLKTHINLNLTLPEFSNTIQQKADSTGVFFPIKKLNYTGGLTINQPLPTDGNIYIQSGLQSFKDYFTGSYSGTMNTRLGFTQPLDAIYGYNAIRSQLKQAELNYESSSKRLHRSELDLVYNVSAAYYALLRQQRGAEIAKLDLDRQQDAYDISQKKYSAGLIREVDALQLEVDLAGAQSSYDMAKHSQNATAYRLKELLGIELNDSVILNSDLNYQPVIVDVEKAVGLALENRLEIRENEIYIEQQKLTVKQQQAQGMVRGNFNAYFERVGIANPMSSVGFDGSIRNSYDDFLNRPFSYGIGFTISVPILDWGQNRSLVRAAEARLRQLSYTKIQTERSIETEVRNLVGNLNTNLRRLQLLEKNVAVAEKSFAITLQRYTDGDIDSQSLALERNRLNTAYNTHLDAYINYQLSLADLMRQTFYDFSTGTAVE
ncbi:MAG: TolC family protein [Dysgonamonadaceae bacterium]|jgi:outer membrane protein TolC|nr:TolC family protein [Dysgonamonadaceae bacterium]